jgi:hypothetical protein
VRHARPNWLISSRLRVLKNYCFALVEYCRITLKRGADTSNLVVEYGSVYMRNR